MEPMNDEYQISVFVDWRSDRLLDPLQNIVPITKIVEFFKGIEKSNVTLSYHGSTEDAHYLQTYLMLNNISVKFIHGSKSPKDITAPYVGSEEILVRVTKHDRNSPLD